MPVLTKAPTLGDLLKFECCSTYSRETVPLKAGMVYPLGSVLGRITATGIYRFSPTAEVAGDEGAEVAVAVLLEAVDATSAEAIGVVVARGPVILSDTALVFDSSIDLPAERAAKLAQLAAAGLVARPTA